MALTELTSAAFPPQSPLDFGNCWVWGKTSSLVAVMRLFGHCGAHRALQKAVMRQVMPLGSQQVLHNGVEIDCHTRCSPAQSRYGMNVGLMHNKSRGGGSATRP